MSLIAFCEKNKQKLIELFLYGIFGLLAFFVNVIAFYVFANVFGWHYLLSNALAWITATTFAFFTNKLIVFRSDGGMAKEAVSFLAARLFTLAIDMFLMWLFVSVILMKELLAKIIVNVVVIVTNYVMIKLLVFRK